MLIWCIMSNNNYIAELKVVKIFWDMLKLVAILMERHNHIIAYSETQHTWEASNELLVIHPLQSKSGQHPKTFIHFGFPSGYKQALMIV